jgi:hypothetical protein
VVRIECSCPLLYCTLAWNARWGCASVVKVPERLSHPAPQPLYEIGFGAHGGAGGAANFPEFAFSGIFSCPRVS